MQKSDSFCYRDSDVNPLGKSGEVLEEEAVRVVLMCYTLLRDFKVVCDMFIGRPAL